MRKKTYGVLIVLLLVTVGIGVVTTDDYIKSLTTGVTNLGVISVFVTFFVEQVKEAITFVVEKKKIAYDISMNSQFAYDVHSAYLDFCKKYIERVYDITENMISEGNSSLTLEHSRTLYNLRKEHSIFIPETVHMELKDFEHTLRVLGAGYEFQQQTIGSSQHREARLKSIDKTHKLFLQLIDQNNDDEDRSIMNVEEIISYIRNTVGINRINELKHDLLDTEKLS